MRGSDVAASTANADSSRQDRARVFYTTATLPKVRIGDRVQVWYDRFDDANVCREVEITRRAKPDAVPPATIPPAKD